jgi:hypothetical protein
VLLAVSVSTLFPVVGFGLNDAVIPGGGLLMGTPNKGERKSWTLPVKPFWGITWTVDVLVAP